MILERLFIQNYKQLRDPVELFPPEGAVGVVGANGAGKSTLFESILWAFFGSRGGGPRFANESIPWSGGSTKDPSVVEVTLATDGGSYMVRRQLKGGSTSAEVRDGDGRTIVTGTSDVIRWVEETLLGMDRTAFEATFYARQKELRFFANDDGISRVRRISKLLGIGGVEAAQALLREDRNALRSEARVLEKRLAEADLESFQAELKEAREACDRLEGELEKVSTELVSAEEELRSARAARDALESSYREHSRLTADLRAAEAEGRRAADRVAEGEKDLADLAAAEEELGRLKPRTARLPEVTAELEKLEEDRRLAEERDRGRRECLQGQRRVSDIEGEVWDVLEGLDGGDGEVVPGFDALFELDGPDLLQRAVAVLDGATGELEKAEARHEELRDLSARHEAYRAAEEEVLRARARHEEAKEEARGLREELEDLSGGEDPERREEELRGEEERLKELAALHRGRANAHEREAKNVDRAREAIDSGAEDHCPTCHRGFDGGEQEEISDTLKRQAASLRRQAAVESAEAEKLTRSAEESAEKLQRLRARTDRWRSLRESLVRAEDRAADRLTTLEGLDKELAERRESLEGTRPPTREDLQDARDRRARLRGVRDARPAVAALAAEHSRLTGRVSELLARLEELSDLSYDAEAHREKSAEKDRLERARGRVEELERRLETRAGVEETLEEARGRVEEAGKAAEKLREEVKALGFDEEAYEAAAGRVASSEERVSGLRDAREGLGGDWKDADHRIERAKTELKRLDDDRKLANERAAAAARMDEMDGLFTEFFRSLTARARPMLEAEASGLVRELTDNRYESMEFDENYRVRLLDRFDDSYAIERFSGGEADVASLSARVALSRLVAARGGNTLGFLVLDEVFGSLDAGRRNNVLLAVERLKRSFGQIFIISHVGEVQESALVDEIWLIEEDEEGKSRIRRMDAPLGGTPEPLLEAGLLGSDGGPE
ncbi:AAA family ATPase [Rubrobacter tropicus]|uniref:AAA family ATPase n=1 Tax=Rubrobacter tropicus TaxID=2653851 RepID=UPI00140C8945|nr:SMC family ATPase [Rubrobacter tropicus]